MSTNSTADGEWTVVTKDNKKHRSFGGGGSRVRNRNRSKRTGVGYGSKTPYQQSLSSSDEVQSLTFVIIKERLDRLQEELRRTTGFVNSFLAARNDVGLNGFVPEAIVCYGVGNFASSSSSNLSMSTIPAPLWQLALALELRRIFQKDSDKRRVSCSFYDPCTSETEREMLNELGMEWIESNERGNRRVDGPTLFFMPHCPMMLYENVCLANWDQLEHVVMIGNSVRAYTQRLVGTIPPGLAALEQCTAEAPLDIKSTEMDRRHIGYGSATMEAAFNDMFLTLFRIADGTDLPQKPDDEAVGDVGELL